MNFTYPLALILLLAIPAVAYLGWPRQYYRRVRDSLSLVLRGLIVLCVVLALSGMQVSQSADRLAVVFLIDVSDSMGPDVQEQQLEYVREALQNMGPDDVAGVVAFGAEPRTERTVNAVRELAILQAQPVTSNTDLAEAIRHGMALFPNDAARRLVILTDGRPTVGNTQAAVQQAAAVGVEVSYVTFSRELGPEVQVTNLNMPSSVTAGQSFDLTFTIQAEEATSATVTVLDRGETIFQEAVDLKAGANNYVLPLPSSSPGFKDIRVQVEPTGNDSFYQNNQLSTFSQIVGPPRALLVSTSDSEVQNLLPALEEAGVDVDIVRPERLRSGLASLAQYNTVLIANVPATQLSNRVMEELDAYVRDLGGGLVFIGGPDSYAPGGYFQTPLERALPVEMQIRDQQRLPQLTIVYVIDRSGSMGSASGNSNIPNIELAKEAIIRSIDFLQPTDRAGAVSFDTVGYWVADLQPVLDRLGLQRLVATLRASGGTDILAGMRLVANTIINEPSDRKHIILLTDGGAAPGNLVELTETLKRENEVTTSVISIGGGAEFLADMAEVGGGNYHEVNSVESIPTIFTMETVLASRSYIFEEPFVPALTANSPIMAGINSAPFLLGYVATSPKQTAQVILSGPEPYRDPILASWQYGLGRAVAFTSDATARWGQNWVTWPDFTRFWSQAVRWTITEGANSNLETQVVLEGEQARLIVDARDDEGGFLNGLNLQAAIVDPILGSNRLPLRQVAPGRYEALFVPGSEGAYFLRIDGEQVTSDGNTLRLNQTNGWVLSYSPEYDVQTRGVDVNLLEDIAQMTAGRDMTEDATLPFVHNLVARNAYTPLWPYLLLVAMLLLPLDIAMRRLIITQSDWRRLRQAIFGVGRTEMVEGPSERLSTLIGAKTRGRERAEGSATSIASALRSSQSARRAERERAVEPQPEAADDQPRFVRPSETLAEQKQRAAANVAGELLKTRRQRRVKDDDGNDD